MSARRGREASAGVTVSSTPCPSSCWTHCICLFRRVVKEEISDDNAKLPCFNGRVVSWVSEMDALHPSCASLLACMPGCTASPLTTDMCSTRGLATPPQSFLNTSSPLYLWTSLAILSCVITEDYYRAVRSSVSRGQ